MSELPGRVQYTPGGSFGLQDPQLAGIIQATDDALSKIRTLRYTVVETSGAVYRSNQSRSGKILEARFNDWASEFGQIEGNLSTLNEKVKGLRQLLLRAADESESQASY
ncbi:hypothetical protein [Saccharopolyspora hattusasensis]|uniref:hypothetical protein n=1 Tax=Saccharopolyspora hattusasensis TaxID=1128679 RepID=UPI003D98DF8A